MSENSSEEVKKIESFDIDISPDNITLREYEEYFSAGYLDIPEFQRPYIWDKNTASSFIESILLSLPVPNVFLYRSKKYKSDLIIDGHQRIITVVSFIKGEFVDGKNKGEIFKLTKKAGYWEGRTYESLDDRAKDRFNNYIMRATVIEQFKPNDDTSMLYVFKRLNTGGKPLNSMEIRMCSEFGKFTKLLKKLNELPKWRALLGQKDPNQRLKDAELILRFFALHEIGQEYSSPMGKALDKYISDHKEESDEWLKEKEKLFIKTVNKALMLKEKPFHVIKEVSNPEQKEAEEKKKKHKRLNLTVLDSIMVALADSNFSEEESLKSAYDKLFKRNDFLEIIYKREGTAGTYSVRDRLRIAREEFCDD